MKVIKNEEERFHETLSEGLAILSGVIDKAKSSGTSIVPGADAFRLYDTYGFPFELTEEFAEEAGITVDRAGFESRNGKPATTCTCSTPRCRFNACPIRSLGEIHEASEFIGYEQLTCRCNGCLSVARMVICQNKLRKGKKSSSSSIEHLSMRKAVDKLRIKEQFQWRCFHRGCQRCSKSAKWTKPTYCSHSFR